MHDRYVLLPPAPSTHARPLVQEVRAAASSRCAPAVSAAQRCVASAAGMLLGIVDDDFAPLMDAEGAPGDSTLPEELCGADGAALLPLRVAAVQMLLLVVQRSALREQLLQFCRVCLSRLCRVARSGMSGTGEETARQVMAAGCMKVRQLRSAPVLWSLC